MFSTGTRVLAGWRGLLVIFVTSVVVHAGAIDTGFLLDDYLQRSMLEGTFPAKRSPLDLYNFVNDDDRDAMREGGLIPWWAHPQLEIAFWRPLSSATLWLDHEAWPNAPLPGHLHSLAWWLIVLAAAFTLYRQLLPPRAAWLATLVFALAPCHAMPLAWIANRNALVSLAFGVPGLWLYLRYRMHGRPRDAVAAGALFSLALLGGEYSICLGGYVVAFELTRRGDAWRRRVIGIAAFGIPALGYLAIRGALGYGANGAGFYIDPLRSPGRFLAHAPRRLATLLQQSVFSLDDGTLAGTTATWAVIGVTVVAMAALIYGGARALARRPPDERRTGHWFALGSLLALVPVLAVAPTPRVLGASVLGLAPVVALMLDTAWFPSTPHPRRGVHDLVGAVALVLGFSHLVHAPVTSRLAGDYYAWTSRLAADHARSLRDLLDDPARDEVIVVRGGGATYFTPFMLEPHGAPPARFHVLVLQGHALVLRVGPRALEMVMPTGRGPSPSDLDANLFLDDDVHYARGTVLRIGDTTITIAEVDRDGLARRVRFDFDRDLDAQGVAVVNHTIGGFVKLALPAPGFGVPVDP